MFSNMVAEIATTHQVNHKVQIFSIFERVVHINKKSVTKL